MRRRDSKSRRIKNEQSVFLLTNPLEQVIDGVDDDGLGDERLEDGVQFESRRHPPQYRLVLTGMEQNAQRSWTSNKVKTLSKGKIHKRNKPTVHPSQLTRGRVHAVVEELVETEEGFLSGLVVIGSFYDRRSELRS